MKQILIFESVLVPTAMSQYQERVAGVADGWEEKEESSEIVEEWQSIYDLSPKRGVQIILKKNSAINIDPCLWQLPKFLTGSFY